MMIALIAFFVLLPILLIVVGYLVTRSGVWAGVVLIVIAVLSGLAFSLFGFALILGCILGAIFPKRRVARWP